MLGLFVGPALVLWTRGTDVTMAALDGAVLGIVPALLLLRMLPHLVEDAGMWAVAVCAIGYLGLSVVESRTHSRAKDVGLAVVLPSLAIHGFLDGAGLALAFQRSANLGTGRLAMAAALVVHKIPEGLFVATLLLPKLGASRTTIRLGALASATVLGALSGRELLEHAPDRALHLIVALGLGVMLRMATHRHEAVPAARRARVASGVAFVSCVSILFAIPDPERLLSRAQPGELTALQSLTPLLLEAAPGLLIALLLAEVFVILTVHKQVERPSMLLPLMALTVPLLGFLFTALRLLLEPLARSGAKMPSATPPAQNRREALFWLLARNAPRAALVLPSYAVGVALSVTLEAALPRGIFEGLSWAVFPLAAAFALTLRIGIPGTTILAVLFVHKGFPLSGALLFTAVAAYPWEWRTPGVIGTRPARVAAASAVVLSAFLPASARFGLHALAAHHHPSFEWLAGGLLALWTVAQLLWLGPRQWFARLDGDLCPAPKAA